MTIDAYNWGTCQTSQSTWQTFPEIFEYSYVEMDALTDKPMVIGHGFSGVRRRQRRLDPAETFLTDISFCYPQMRAVIWFHRNSQPASAAGL